MMMTSSMKGTMVLRTRSSQRTIVGQQPQEQAQEQPNEGLVRAAAR
jgi:hypothetical protein